jgi:hypothetical protein
MFVDVRRMGKAEHAHPILLLRAMGTSDRCFAHPILLLRAMGTSDRSLPILRAANILPVI